MRRGREEEGRITRCVCMCVFCTFFHVNIIFFEITHKITLWWWWCLCVYSTLLMVSWNDTIQANDLDPIAACRNADVAACKANNVSYHEPMNCWWKIPGGTDTHISKCCAGSGATTPSSTPSGAPPPTSCPAAPASSAKSSPSSPTPSARTRRALETAMEAARTFRGYFAGLMRDGLTNYCKTTEGKANAKCGDVATFRGNHVRSYDHHTDDGRKDGSCALGEFAQVGTTGKTDKDFKSLRMDGSFRPTNEGEFNISGVTACEYLIWEPMNNGSMKVNGCANTSVAVIDPKNSPPNGKSLSFNGGEAIIVGGENTGKGPIAFENVRKVTLVDLRNTGIVSFDSCPDVFIASVDNTASTSRIIFVNNASASLLNVSNGGSVSVDGGSFVWHMGTNTGAINASRASHVEVANLKNVAADIVFLNVQNATLRDVSNNKGHVRISGGGRYLWEGGTNSGNVEASMDYAYMKLSSNTGKVTCTGGEIVVEVADNTGGTLNALNADCKGTIRVPSGSKKGIVVVNAAVKIEYFVAPPPSPPPPLPPPSARKEIAKVDVSLDISGAAVEDGLDESELAKVASSVAKASGAKTSEVKVMGVNYTMTTTAKLSGFVASAVDAAMKKKLSDAFATATGAPKAATRVGSVKDVPAASSPSGGRKKSRRRRRLLQSDGGVELEYLVESKDATVVKSASDKVKGGGGGGGGTSSGSNSTNTATFAASLASGLKSAGVSATVQSTSQPEMKAKIIVEVVSADASVAEKLTTGKVTATDISAAMTNAGLAAKTTGMTTKKTMIAAPSPPPPAAAADDDVIISAFGIDADLMMVCPGGGGVIIILASFVLCIRRCCRRNRRDAYHVKSILVGGHDPTTKGGDSRAQQYNDGAANHQPSSPPLKPAPGWNVENPGGGGGGGGGGNGEEKVYEVRNPYSGLGGGGRNKGNTRKGMTRVNRGA